MVTLELLKERIRQTGKPRAYVRIVLPETIRKRRGRGAQLSLRNTHAVIEVAKDNKKGHLFSPIESKSSFPFKSRIKIVLPSSPLNSSAFQDTRYTPSSDPNAPPLPLHQQLSPNTLISK